MLGRAFHGFGQAAQLLRQGLELLKILGGAAPDLGQGCPTIWAELPRNEEGLNRNEGAYSQLAAGMTQHLAHLAHLHPRRRGRRAAVSTSTSSRCSPRARAGVLRAGHTPPCLQGLAVDPCTVECSREPTGRPRRFRRGCARASSPAGPRERRRRSRLGPPTVIWPGRA